MKQFINNILKKSKNIYQNYKNSHCTQQYSLHNKLRNPHSSFRESDTTHQTLRNIKFFIAGNFRCSSPNFGVNVHILSYNSSSFSLNYVICSNKSLIAVKKDFKRYSPSLPHFQKPSSGSLFLGSLCFSKDFWLRHT